MQPNDENKTGDTSLHNAVRGGDLRIVALLCKFAGDAKVTNHAHETPLSLAVDADDPDMLELLSPETQQAIHERLVTDMNIKQTTVPDLHQLPTIDSPTLHAEVDGILDDGDESGDGGKFTFPETAKENAGPVHAADSSFEAQLDADERRKMETHRISKTNPFTRLKRQGTRQALEEMQDIARAKDDLPELKGWLEKKKVYLIVAEKNICPCQKRRNKQTVDSHLNFGDRARCRIRGRSDGWCWLDRICYGQTNRNRLVMQKTTRCERDSDTRSIL